MPKSGMSVRLLESRRPTVGKKCPYFRGILRVRPAKIQRPEWLAGEAVLIVPVSARNSLLTGNFAGNFVKSRLLARQRRKIMASLQGFRCEFPTQRNRELFWRNRESWRENREFCRPELKSSPNEIFGAKSVWVMSAVTPKADINPSHCHVRFVPIADIRQRWVVRAIAVRLPPRSRPTAARIQ